MGADLRSERVKLDGSDAAVAPHFGRHQADEIAGAGSWLQYLAALETKALQSLVNASDDGA